METPQTRRESAGRLVVTSRPMQLSEIVKESVAGMREQAALLRTDDRPVSSVAQTLDAMADRAEQEEREVMRREPQLHFARRTVQ